MNSITASFTRSYLDTVAATRAVNRLQPRVRVFRRLIIGAGVSGLTLVLLGVGGSWGVTMISLSIAVSAVMWLLPFALAMLVRQNSPAWRDVQSYEFSPAGVAVRVSGGRMHMRWNAVTRIDETKAFLVLFTATLRGHAIPKAALPAGNTVGVIRSWFSESSTASPLPSALDTGDAATSAQPVLAVSFVQRPAEVYRALMAVYTRGGRIWPYFLLMLALGWYIGGQAAYAQWHSGGWRAVDWGTTSLAIIPSLLMLGIRPFTAASGAYRVLRGDPASRGAQSVFMDPTGVGFAGPLYTGHVEWTAMMKVVETREFFLFFVMQTQAHYVPKRLLDVGEQARARSVITAGVGFRADLLAGSGDQTPP